MAGGAAGVAAVGAGAVMTTQQINLD